MQIIGNNNRIVISDNVLMRNAELWIEDDKNCIEIGEGTKLTGKIHLACIESSRIEIGKKCLFSSDVILRTGDSHSIIDMQGKRINPSQNIRIADHVWVGNRAMIHKGSSVAENSIVGAGAIVTHAFLEPNVIIAGVPAKVVKQNINWNYKRLTVS